MQLLHGRPNHHSHQDPEVNVTRLRAPPNRRLNVLSVYFNGTAEVYTYIPLKVQLKYPEGTVKVPGCFFYILYIANYF